MSLTRWMAVTVISLPALCPEALSQEATAPAEPLVAAVRFEGLAGVSETFCRGRVVTAPGHPFSQTVLDEDVLRLLRTGKFLDVRAETVPRDDGVLVQFQLRERPIIASVGFVGNEKFSDKDLLKELDLNPGDPLNIFAVRQGLTYIEQRYKDAGYAEVDVRLDQQLLDAERRVVFVIEEGPRIRVRSVRFEGNSAFSAKQLAEKIGTQTYFPLFRTGDFNPDRAARDAFEIQKFYQDRGYLDARVSYRTDPLDKPGDLALVFVLEEGDLYTLREIRFEGNDSFSDDQLLAAMTLRPAETMRLDYLEKDLEALRKKYGQNGMIYSTVTSSPPTFTAEPGEVFITVMIEESPRYRVGGIHIRGNQQTKDKVIRRELDLYPEDIFDTTQLEQSEKELRQSGLFSQVQMVPVGEQPGVREVLVDVTESDQTTRFIVGGGVGSNSGLAGTVMLESRNFDIADWPRSWGELFRARAFRGAGQYFRIEAAPGSQLTSFRIDFRDPYFLDRPYAYGTSLYLFERGRQDYDEQRLGTNISMGKSFEDGLFEGWAGELSFRLEDVEIDDLADFPAKDIYDARGHSILTAFKGRLVRNRTDSRFNPTTGDIWSISYEQAAGSYNFGRLEGGYTWYRTLRVDELERPSVLALKAEAGYILGDAPVFERFYAGGLGSLRGFEFRGISPRDGPFFDDDQRIGGDFRILTGAEYSFPLYAEMIRGVLFTDMGTVEEDFELTDWRASVGVGVRIFVENYFGPIPIEFNLAFPVSKDGDDDTQVFSFAIGISF